MPQRLVSEFFRFSLFCLIFTWAGPEVCCSVVNATDSLQGIPKDAVRFETGGPGDVKLFASGNSLYAEIKMAQADSSLKIPRLANVVLSIQWQSAPDSKISLQPEPDHWIIPHGKPPAADGDILIINLDTPPAVFDESLVTHSTPDGSILLPAKLAITAGENLRYEPQTHKNTVGYWSNIKATAEWKLQTSQKRSYEIDILQGCGTGHGGSHVEVLIGKESRVFTVEETGHFQNFIWRTVGTIELPADETMTLKLAPRSKPGGAVMDVRAVRLSPAGSKRNFDSQLAAPESLPRKQ